MSEYSTPEQRTESPTDRRMGTLRKEGQIFFSNDIATVASMIAGFLMTAYFIGAIFNDLKMVLIKSYTMIGSRELFDVSTMRNGFVSLVMMMAPKIAIIVVIVSVVASLAVFLQTKWNIKEHKINFKIGLLNPISGLKRIFSIQGFVNFAKSFLKLVIILPMGFFALKGYAPQMISLMHLTMVDIFTFVSQSINAVFWKILYVLIALALFDYFYGKWNWLKQNRMTKDEVKDERKAVEGDEETKRKIQMKGIRRIMQRLSMSVPKADVVVTNPTHYAVALQYDRTSMAAPIVVAKGQGFMAKRIREIARESKVPILERKALARALYQSTEVGSVIPHELFRAVAEVLAYVFRLKQPRSASARAAR